MKLILTREIGMVNNLFIIRIYSQRYPLCNLAPKAYLRFNFTTENAETTEKNAIRTIGNYCPDFI